MHSLRQDLRYAVRRLVTTRGFTAIASAVARLASYLPVHRATRINPMVTLRYE